MLSTSIFSCFHNVFYPSQNKYQFLSHIDIDNFYSFQLEQLDNFSEWYRVNSEKKQILNSSKLEELADAISNLMSVAESSPNG